MIGLEKNMPLANVNLSTSVSPIDFVDAIRTDDGCIYSSDGMRLLKYDGYWDDELIIEIRDVAVICDNAFSYIFKKIILPETLRIIGSNALPHCEIESKSPYFIVEDGILYTADKKRIIVNCSNSEAVFEIPHEVSQIDTNAFRLEDEEYRAPYYLKLSSPIVNLFNYDKIIAPDRIVASGLQSKGFNLEDIIIDDIFVDKFGVVYSSNKKTLLCYPRELKYKSYEILASCEHISEGAFPGYEEPDDDGTVYRYGNSLKVLVLPPNLRSIAPWSFSGCFWLQAIVYNRQEDKQIRELLNSLEGYHIKKVINSLIYIPIFYRE